YNAKIPLAITHLDAAFSEFPKKPRVMHGCSDMGLVKFSDPTIGHVSPWGRFWPGFERSELQFPANMMYGAGPGHAVLPNVMDISQVYGAVVAEGTHFSSRVYFGHVENKVNGLYLEAQETKDLAFPRIPSGDVISALWIAKTSAIPTLTEGAVGIMSGSTL